MTNDFGDVEISIYPNPVISEFTMEISILTDDELNVTICDIDGKLVYNDGAKHYSIGKHNLRFDVKELNLSTGTYICNLIGTNANISRKIIVR